MTKEEYIEDRDLELCQFNDTCDNCNLPSGGTWVKLYSDPEGVTEAEYYICGECIENKSINSGRWKE